VLQKKGFSYIEVVMAVTLSAVIFTAVLPLLFNTITKNRDTRYRLVAYESASNEIEKLREQKISSLVAPNTLSFDIPEIPDSVGTVNITKTLGDEKIASVNVMISWDYKGKSNEVELNTYLYGSTE
jgi:type II secretory pathway pseudopilin PulG